MVDDSALLHGEKYDAAKAREYYLRTRKLKGRQAGQQEPSGKPRSPAAKPTSGQRKGAAPSKSAAKRRAETKAKVTQLKARLAQLKSKLAELVKAAKARSGVDTPDKPKTASKAETPKEKAARNAADKSRRPLTAKQKADQAKRSKEHYAKTKDTSSSKDIEQLRAKIKDVEKQLRDAMASAKRNTSKGKDPFSNLNSALDKVFKDLGVDE
jgi:hypothetical protein